jgi:holo-[acyl-carrier protein] synthase
MITSGVDLIEVARVSRAVERHGQRLLDRIFTPAEQAYCAGRPTSLAGRFAVKEAVSKAFGTGIGDLTWLEMEVLPDGAAGRSCSCTARRRTCRRQGWDDWSISIAHTETHAIGFVVATGG